MNGKSDELCNDVLEDYLPNTNGNNNTESVTKILQNKIRWQNSRNKYTTAVGHAELLENV